MLKELMDKGRVRIIREVALDFSDVLIVPEPSSLTSRKEVDLVREFEFLYSPRKIACIPVIAANMASVCTPKVAWKMAERNMLACLPKTLDYSEFSGNENIIQSVGLKDKPDPNAVWICLDTPTAYLDIVIQRTKELREMCPEAVLIVGNVVTKIGVQNLILAGADIVKCGIGSGSGCATRLVTGVGMPQLTTVIECSEKAYDMGGMIISDGGCVVPGDITKALAAGADMVFLGGMLAGHDENGQDFYGSSSERGNSELSGGLKDYRAAEGWELKLPARGSLNRTLQDIEGGLRSACSYCGARDIKALPRCATFVMVNRQANTSLLDYRI